MKTGNALHEAQFNEKLIFVGDWRQFDCHTLMVGVWNQDTFTRNCLCAQANIEINIDTLNAMRCRKWHTLMVSIRLAVFFFLDFGILLANTRNKTL